MEQGSHNGTDHFPQKGIGPDFKHQYILLNKKEGLKNISKPGKTRVQGMSKKRTVQFPMEYPGIVVKKIQPGTAPELKTIPEFMGKGRAARDYMVPVGSGPGIKTGVEIPRGFPGFQDPYILREETVEGRDKPCRIYPRKGGKKISHLPHGMYPGIGPPRTIKNYFFFV
jgi:hypothetical protein